MAAPVLVIEDDDRIRETTRLVLENEGYDVSEAVTAEDALSRLASIAPACIIVDLMLPGMDGFECCRQIRRTSEVPIIMLTARSDPFDVVAGLEAGADDYVTKPFHPKELSARVRALLRRVPADAAGAGGEGEAVLVLGEVEVRPDEGIVRRAGVEVSLTRTEFRLLVEMAARAGRVFSRRTLLSLVWGADALATDEKLVDAHIYRLRAKIEDDPAEPRHVVTVRGMGYKVVL